MKNLLITLMAAGSTLPALAQDHFVKQYSTDAELPRWVIDVNLLGGLATQDLTTAPSMASYPNALNMNTGQLKYKNGYSLGGDAQLGFFFGKKRHFGLGTGIMLMQQYGDATLDNYHVEYKATDGNGNIFRQLITGNNIQEKVTSTMINIPVVLKYKNRFSKHWGFTADAGALINLQMKNAYTTQASFDHEAIYKFTTNGDGGKTSVYDNSPVPDVNDWMITKAQFQKNDPSGNVRDYFNTKRANGYNVGVGLEPNSKTGKTAYTSASVGLLLQPSVNYFLSDRTALNLGAYYMFQPFKNDAQSGYKLTDGNGTYSSVLGNVKTANNQAYGLNLGVRFFLGRKQDKLSITSMERKMPTECGVCDGSLVLHGLTPNKQVSVDYTLNGGNANTMTTTVAPDGNVNITGLCAGSYTGITAKIKKRTAMGAPATLADPVMTISQRTTNPSVAGTCDGTVQFSGLRAGKTVSISYSMNGMRQVSFVGVVSAGNSVTISGLCEGIYSGIVATMNKCSVNGSDFTLAAPVPVTPPAETPVINIATPILFEVNDTTIYSASYSILDEAANELNDNKNATIIVDGHADASGSAAKNKTLSANRARSVKTQLVKRGISPNRVKAVGHGDTQPAASNSTYEGKKANRRATMKLVQ